MLCAGSGLSQFTRYPIANGVVQSHTTLLGAVTVFIPHVLLLHEAMPIENLYCMQCV